MAELGKSYGEALFLLEEGKDIEGELRLALDVLKGIPGLEGVLMSPRIGGEERAALAKKVFHEVKDQHLLSLLLLLCKKRKISLLPGVCEGYLQLLDKKNGTERGIVHSVRPLSEEEIHRLEKALGNEKGTRVRLENRLDESLIGGVTVTLGDRHYDGSIKGRARSLREALMKGA